MGIAKGFFITFEGIEGSGKSTQIASLSSFLKKKITKKVFLTREPGGTKISEKIRKLVIDDLDKKSNPLTELFLLFAARAEHYDLIKDFLSKGYIVLCDRYVDSTIAYQHYNGSIKLEVIRYLQKLIDKNKKPDLTFLLDVDPLITKFRISKRKKVLDRFDRESLSTMRIIKKGFLKIAKSNKKRVKIISEKLSIKEVQKKIQYIALSHIKNAKYK